MTTLACSPIVPVAPLFTHVLHSFIGAALGGAPARRVVDNAHGGFVDAKAV